MPNERRIVFNIIVGLLVKHRKSISQEDTCTQSFGNSEIVILLHNQINGANFTERRYCLTNVTCPKNKQMKTPVQPMCEIFINGSE